MKVLIAEKDCKAIDDIVLALNSSFPDWELITTDSGKECLNRVKDNSIDLFILGLDLEDMSSFDVISKIYSLSEAAIIALSSKNDGMGMVKAFNLGADQCIVKPFSQIELIAQVRALLKRVSVKNQLAKKSVKRQQPELNKLLF